MKEKDDEMMAKYFNYIDKFFQEHDIHSDLPMTFLKWKRANDLE